MGLYSIKLPGVVACVVCASVHVTQMTSPSDTIEVKHTYNQAQIDWVKAGSALNKIKTDVAAGLA